MVDERKVLTALETFKAFNISENAGYQAVKAGRFPVRPIVIGGSKTRPRYRFSRAEVERVLAGASMDGRE